MSADPTPYELLRAENTDLRARLELAEERAFDQGAAIARLMVEKAHLEAEIGQLRDKQAELVAALETIKTSTHALLLQRVLDRPLSELYELKDIRDIARDALAEEDQE